MIIRGTVSMISKRRDWGFIVNRGMILWIGLFSAFGLFVECVWICFGVSVCVYVGFGVV